jgi:hypothetical protein
MRGGTYEPSAGLALAPDTGPLLRMLLRLRHDLVMLGRAAVTPLPEAHRARLEAPLAQAGAAFADCLRASGAALGAHRGRPSLAAVDGALAAHAAQIAALRREGATRSLAVNAMESLFALGFAFDQMRNNFRDLERCVAEWAGVPKQAGPKRG